VSDTVFFERFQEWKKVMQNCPCRKASHPVDYCLFEGIPCSFLKCPRRVYERQLQEHPPELMEDRLTRLERKVNNLSNSLVKFQSSVRTDIANLLALVQTLVQKNVESE